MYTIPHNYKLKFVMKVKNHGYVLKGNGIILIKATVLLETITQTSREIKLFSIQMFSFCFPQTLNSSLSLFYVKD